MAGDLETKLDTSLDDLVKAKGRGKGKKNQGEKKTGKGKGKGAAQKKEAAAAAKPKVQKAQKKQQAQATAKAAVGLGDKLDMSLDDVVKSQVKKQFKAKKEGTENAQQPKGKAGKSKLWGGAKAGTRRQQEAGKGKAKGKGKGKDQWAAKGGGKKGGGKDKWAAKGGGKGKGDWQARKPAWQAEKPAWAPKWDAPAPKKEWNSGRKGDWGGKGKGKDSWEGKGGGRDSWEGGRSQAYSPPRSPPRYAEREPYERPSYKERVEPYTQRAPIRDAERAERGRGVHAGIQRALGGGYGSSRGAPAEWGTGTRAPKRSREDEPIQRAGLSAGSKRIKVTNIPKDLDMLDIKDAFEAEAGKIATCDMRNGTAWITFHNPKDARKAVDTFDRGELNGKTIEVTFER